MENQRAYTEGIRYAQRLLDLDPLNEATYQRLMRLYALNGDRAGVSRIYQDCIAFLQQELDIEPSPGTKRLYEQLLKTGLISKTSGCPRGSKVKLFKIWQTGE